MRQNIEKCGEENICFNSCYLCSKPAVVGGRGELHSLRQLVWWQSDRVLAAGQEEGGVDTLVELCLKLDRENHSLEIRQWYITLYDIKFSLKIAAITYTVEPLLTATPEQQPSAI